MRKEMTCIFNCNIDEDLRKELAEGKLREYASAASLHNLRAEAMLELGYLDIELNINCLEEENDRIAEATPTLDYFICVKCGDTTDPWDWESWGYADDLIGDDGQAHVDWSADDWQDQLFDDMLKSLVKFERAANKRPGILPEYILSFLNANTRLF